jgi:hypothetical protein
MVRNENLKTKAEHLRDRILSSGFDNRTSSSFSNPTVEQTPNESNQEQKSSELLITGPVHGKDISTRSSQDRPETKASSTSAKETPDNRQQRQKNPNEEQDIVPSKITTKLDTSLGTKSEQSSKTHSQGTTKEKGHVKVIPESKILKQSRQKLDPKIEEDKAKMNLKTIHEQKIKDRKRVQHLIDDAKISFENVKKETKDAKTANKKADIAKSILSEAQAGEYDAESVQMDSEVKNLINEANAANENAKDAMEKYEELHQAADNAVKDFNSKYH